MKLKPNDTVTCVSNSGFENELTVGKSYTVLNVDYDDYPYDGTSLIEIKNDEGDIIDYSNVKFHKKKLI